MQNAVKRKPILTLVIGAGRGLELHEANCIREFLSKEHADGFEREFLYWHADHGVPKNILDIARRSQERNLSPVILWVGDAVASGDLIVSDDIDETYCLKSNVLEYSRKGSGYTAPFVFYIISEIASSITVIRSISNRRSSDPIAPLLDETLPDQANARRCP